MKQIVAVPLFVSSHSRVIESIRYLLGLRPEVPSELMDFTMNHDHGDAGKVAGQGAKDQDLKSRPVSCAVPISMSAALDRHPVLANILLDRAATISRRPAQELVVLIAHGPNDDKENALWLEDLNAVASMVAAKKPFARVGVITLRDDAKASVRDEATSHLRAIVSSAAEQGFRVLIVPVLLYPTGELRTESASGSTGSTT